MLSHDGSLHNFTTNVKLCFHWTSYTIPKYILPKGRTVFFFGIPLFITALQVSPSPLERYLKQVLYLTHKIHLTRTWLVVHSSTSRPRKTETLELFFFDKTTEQFYSTIKCKTYILYVLCQWYVNILYSNVIYFNRKNPKKINYKF